MPEAPKKVVLMVTVEAGKQVQSRLVVDGKRIDGVPVIVSIVGDNGMALATPHSPKHMRQQLAALAEQQLTVVDAFAASAAQAGYEQGLSAQKEQ